MKGADDFFKHVLESTEGGRSAMSAVVLGLENQLQAHSDLLYV